jgi:hypothetical protein
MLLGFGFGSVLRTTLWSAMHMERLLGAVVKEMYCGYQRFLYWHPKSRNCVAIPIQRSQVREMFLFGSYYWGQYKITGGYKFWSSYGHGAAMKNHLA